MEEVCFRYIDLGGPSQVAEYIDLKGENRSREIPQVMKQYFSNFSSERKELLKEKEPKESKGTRRVKIVLCHVNRKMKVVGALK